MCRPGVLLVLLGVIVVILLAQGIWNRLTALRGSEPYRLALERLQNSQELQAKLGSPISEKSWLPSGTLHTEGERGEATLYFKVAGPEDEGDVMAQARRFGGQWTLVLLEVRLKDGSLIKLLPESARAAGSSGRLEGLEEAPRWTYPSEIPSTPDETGRTEDQAAAHIGYSPP
jgi:hypothetical protein